MNSTIDTILGHYSVRSFENTPLTEEQQLILLRSAQAASTSSYSQAYSIIGVSDADLRAQLSLLCGQQAHITTTGQFYIFVADLSKHHEIAESYQVNAESLETTEKMLVSIIDAALAAQNMAIAAESMGLGICYIGGIRNHLDKVCELLQIPEYAMPMFGLTIGIPTAKSEPKPRLPMHLVYHENTYQRKPITMFAAYDAKIQSYYEQRTQGARIEGWTEQMAKWMQKPLRIDVRSHLEKQRLGLK